MQIVRRPPCTSCLLGQFVIEKARGHRPPVIKLRELRSITAGSRARSGKVFWGLMPPLAPVAGVGRRGANDEGAKVEDVATGARAGILERLPRPKVASIRTVRPGNSWPEARPTFLPHFGVIFWSLEPLRSLVAFWRGLRSEEMKLKKSFRGAGDVEKPQASDFAEIGWLPLGGGLQELWSELFASGKTRADGSEQYLNL